VKEDGEKGGARSRKKKAALLRRTSPATALLETIQAIRDRCLGGEGKKKIQYWKKVAWAKKRKTENVGQKESKYRGRVPSRLVRRGRPV